MAMLPVEKFSFAKFQKMPALRTANSAARYPGCAEDVDLELDGEQFRKFTKYRKVQKQSYALGPKFVCAAETRNR